MDKSNRDLRSNPMRTWQHISVLLTAAVACSVGAQTRGPAGQDVQMSPALQKLFQEEMRELLSGAQMVAAGLPMGNWEGIAATSAMMRESYVLEKKLTRAQEKEIAGFPTEFKALDKAFHLQAGRLERAAAAHDAKAAAFQFSRLLENCAACHAKFAPHRFPGFHGPTTG